MNFDWEKIHDNGHGWTTYRAYVPGGWMLLSATETDTGLSESMCFVPDSMHVWEPNRDVMDGVL